MDELKKQIAELLEENRILKDLVATLTAKIAELEARLNKHSGNSSKPPSTDGYKKPVVKNSRERSERRNGGQPGHAGTTKPFTPTPDTVVELKPKETCECGGTIQISEQYTVRQETDIVPLRVVTVEYQAHSGVCEICGKEHKASFPEHLKEAPVSYGTNIQRLATYLSVYQLMPLKRITELFEEVFGTKLSQGFILTTGQEAYEKLAEPEEEVKREIIKSDIAGFDESGYRVDGKLYWLHCASTPEGTVYFVHEKRGIEAMDAMGILPFFKGTAIHDHWKSYYHYMCAHGECNAHHMRHLKWLYEELHQAWAGEMLVLLLRIYKHVMLSKLFGADRLEQEDIEQYQRMYREILTAPLAAAEELPKESKLMAVRLAEFEQEALLFMIDFKVPFTNNLTERDIRMPKAKQKISGGFRTKDGAKRFARIRGFISTVKKRGKNILEGLGAVFKGQALDFLSCSSVQA